MIWFHEFDAVFLRPLYFIDSARQSTCGRLVFPAKIVRRPAPSLLPTDWSRVVLRRKSRVCLHQLHMTQTLSSSPLSANVGPQQSRRVWKGSSPPRAKSVSSTAPPGIWSTAATRSPTSSKTRASKRRPTSSGKASSQREPNSNAEEPVGRLRTAAAARPDDPQAIPQKRLSMDALRTAVDAPWCDRSGPARQRARRERRKAYSIDPPPPDDRDRLPPTAQRALADRSRSYRLSIASNFLYMLTGTRSRTTRPRARWTPRRGPDAAHQGILRRRFASVFDRTVPERAEEPATSFHTSFASSTSSRCSTTFPARAAFSTSAAAGGLHARSGGSRLAGVRRRSVERHAPARGDRSPGYGGKPVRFAAAQATELPFRDGSFDAVTVHRRRLVRGQRAGAAERSQAGAAAAR